MNKIFIGIILVAAMMTINKTATAQTWGNQSNWNTPILTNILPPSGTSGSPGSSSSTPVVVIVPGTSTPISVSPNQPAATSSGVAFQSTQSISTPAPPSVPVEPAAVYPPPSSGVVLPGEVSISVGFGVFSFDSNNIVISLSGEGCTSATLG